MSEQVFEWAGIGAAHVRATVFFENIRSLANATIASGGDFLDFQSIEKVVDGISTVYFAYPVQHGLLDATVNMAVAARNAGVKRLKATAGDNPARLRKPRQLTSRPAAGNPRSPELGPSQKRNGAQARQPPGRLPGAASRPRAGIG